MEICDKEKIISCAPVILFHFSVIFLTFRFFYLTKTNSFNPLHYVVQGKKSIIFSTSENGISTGGFFVGWKYRVSYFNVIWYKYVWKRCYLHTWTQTYLIGGRHYKLVILRTRAHYSCFSSLFFFWQFRVNCYTNRKIRNGNS